MTDETNKNSQPQQINVIVKSDVSNAIGIASFVFGIISIFFLAPIFVPLAVLLGIIAIVKKQLVWGILGLVSAFFGFITSPILMGFFGIMTAAINIPSIQTPSTTGRGTAGFADKAITLEFMIDSLKERSWKNLLPPHTRYKIRAAPGRDYRYICPGYKSEFYGYAALGDRKMEHPTGEISFWSDISEDNPQKDGGEMMVGNNGTVFAKFEIKCPGLEKVVQQTHVSVQFIPIR